MRNAIESEAVLAEILATADAEVHGMRNYETPCYCTFNIVGPSGVRALPLAAGINEGGHYWSERSACAALGCWHKRR